MTYIRDFHEFVVAVLAFGVGGIFGTILMAVLGAAKVGLTLDDYERAALDYERNR